MSLHESGYIWEGRSHFQIICREELRNNYEKDRFTLLD